MHPIVGDKLLKLVCQSLTLYDIKFRERYVITYHRDTRRFFQASFRRYQALAHVHWAQLSFFYKNQCIQRVRLFHCSTFWQGFLKEAYKSWQVTHKNWNVYETTLKISFTFHTQSYGPFTWRRESDICYFIKIRSTVSGVRVTTSWYNIRRKAELVLFTKTCTCLFTIILCSNHLTLGTIFVFHTLIVTVIMGYTIERG